MFPVRKLAWGSHCNHREFTVARLGDRRPSLSWNQGPKAGVQWSRAVPLLQQERLQEAAELGGGNLRSVLRGRILVWFPSHDPIVGELPN